MPLGRRPPERLAVAVWSVYCPGRMPRIAVVAVVAALFALTSVPANADELRTATITLVSATNGHVTATWTLPSGVTAQAVAVANNPQTGSDGSFFTENTVEFDLLQPTQTTYVDGNPLDPGMYWVSVQTFDTDCSYETHNTCFAWSPSVPVNITKPPLELAKSYLAAHGYSAVSVRFWSNAPGALNAIPAYVTHSANGCCRVFFFVDGRFVGTDAPNISRAVSIRSRSFVMVTLVYRLYRPSDASCCPTNGRRPVRFHWTGTRLARLDRLPP